MQVIGSYTTNIISILNKDLEARTKALKSLSLKTDKDQGQGDFTVINIDYKNIHCHSVIEIKVKCS